MCVYLRTPVELSTGPCRTFDRGIFIGRTQLFENHALVEITLGPLCSWFLSRQNKAKSFYGTFHTKITNSTGRARAQQTIHQKAKEKKNETKSTRSVLAKQKENKQNPPICFKTKRKQTTGSYCAAQGYITFSKS